jgi:hypothetical protein
MEIAKHLVLSTAHITETTSQLFDIWADLSPLQRPLDVASTDYGWFVSIRRNPNADQEVPPELLAAVVFAGKQGCAWLLLDRDADTIPELQTFDW